MAVSTGSLAVPLLVKTLTLIPWVSSCCRFLQNPESVSLSPVAAKPKLCASYYIERQPPSGKKEKIEVKDGDTELENVIDELGRQVGDRTQLGCI